MTHTPKPSLFMAGDRVLWNDHKATIDHRQLIRIPLRGDEWHSALIFDDPDLWSKWVPDFELKELHEDPRKPTAAELVLQLTPAEWRTLDDAVISAIDTVFDDLFEERLREMHPKVRAIADALRQEGKR